MAEANNQAAAQLYPDTLFDKEWSAKVGEEVVTLNISRQHIQMVMPWHFENSNIVHMGDLVFNRRYPYIDKTAGASIKNWIEVLEKAQKIYDKDTQFIFGHADNGFEVIGTKDDIKVFQSYLSRLLDQVGADIKAGKARMR
ncbi:MAG: hypothetical protein MZV63_05935 [Marinilabiliales bacterium]|nr:hypothetical protein [Marinilabiliales bacterium]